MPVVFVGHGSPMNAIESNPWVQGFAELGAAIPKPSAILAVSAHWFVGGTYLTANEHPKTIHDFGGFPQALYEIQYRAPGNVDLAERVRALLGQQRASLSDQWGLDHGTWSVLHWMYPAADVPVVQLSIDHHLDTQGHFELAQSLAALRDEGVLILGSGNVVHNLRHAFSQRQVGSNDTPDWAKRFDNDLKQVVSQRDAKALRALLETADGRMAHPTPDHFLPLIYAYAASNDSDRLRFSNEGFDLGSIAMRNVIFG